MLDTLRCFGAVRFARTVVAGVARAQRRRAAIRELHALDDRMLKDIGLCRGQIPYVVDRSLAADRAAVPAADRRVKADGCFDILGTAA